MNKSFNPDLKPFHLSVCAFLIQLFRPLQFIQNRRRLSFVRKKLRHKGRLNEASSRSSSHVTLSTSEPSHFVHLELPIMFRAYGTVQELWECDKLYFSASTHNDEIVLQNPFCSVMLRSNRGKKVIRPIEGLFCDRFYTSTRQTLLSQPSVLLLWVKARQTTFLMFLRASCSLGSLLQP